MADSVTVPASFCTQADALLWKNLTFQKRNVRTNCRLISVPIVLIIMLYFLGILLGFSMDSPKTKCGCKSGTDVCGLEYSDQMQASSCEVKKPIEWPPTLQIPVQEYTAVQTDFITYPDLPKDSCRKSRSCPAIILLTGTNQAFGESISEHLLGDESTIDSDTHPSTLILGSTSEPRARILLTLLIRQILHSILFNLSVLPTPHFMAA